MHRTTSRLLAAAAASVVTAGVLAGTAVALTSHAPTTFYACENHATKAVSSISANAGLRCPAGTSKVTWGSVGPAGSPGIGLAGLFGDSSSGSATIGGGTTVLANDKYYKNLTVNSGATLDANGFRIFVAGTLTLVGTATIENNGLPSTAGGGPGAPSGTIGGGQQGAFITNAGAWGNALGGTGGTGLVASPGTVARPVASAGGANVFDAAEAAISGHGLDGSVINGGSGGGDDCGGGAGGGGVVVVVALSIVHTGSGTSHIEALGGSGAGGGCGGGGGGGGVVTVISSSLPPAGLVLSANGGPGDQSNPGGAGLAKWLG